MASRSDMDLVHHPGEGDALADVLFSGDPGDGSLDAERDPICVDLVRLGG